jgi:hypothetical protein
MFTKKCPLIKIRIVAVYLTLGVSREELSPSVVLTFVLNLKLLDSLQEIIRLHKIHRECAHHIRLIDIAHLSFPVASADVFAHRARLAFLAISTRRSLLITLAREGPPIKPPFLDATLRAFGADDSPLMAS